MITALAGPESVAGGVWEVVVNQSLALRDAGHDVSIAAGWLGTDPPTSMRGLPVDLVPVKPIVPQLGLRGLVGVGWPAALRKALQGADVAHVHLCRDYLTMSATRIVSRLRIPLVAQSHGMLYPPRSLGFKVFDRVMTDPAMGRTHTFITLTDHERPALQAMGVAPDRLATIGNSTPDPKLSWKPPAPGAPARLLFASRLHAEKQVMVFVDTVARLRRKGHAVEGVIAGPDHGDLSRLLDFMAKDDHASYLTYVGALSREQLLQEFAKASIFMFPSLRESFGLVIVEALSVGTPMISTNATPLAETIAESGAALVTEPITEAFTAAAESVLADRHLQKSLSLNGRALYEEKWTCDIMAKLLVDLYDHVIDAESARR